MWNWNFNLFVQSKEKCSGEIGLRLIVNMKGWFEPAAASAFKVFSPDWLGIVQIAKLANRRDGALEPERMCACLQLLANDRH